MSVPRVLVVDDDEVLREALCTLLSERGFEVVGEAGDGAQGVSLARERHPDVVLMDFRMPGMDGLEATNLIKADAPLVQAVVFTAYDDQTLDLEAARADVYCLLVKGCSPQLMLDMLRQAARRKWELESARTRSPFRVDPT
ncbi:MAG: response regulator transcription factor [Actinobacteria bacterium]|nr:MAG: response regulator transcription factor [Actinomycetota bacterium]